MPEHLIHQKLEIHNFTAFREVELEFVPGINIFSGENGTGKTHIMKALYAAQLTQARQLRSISETLASVFQISDLLDLIKLGTPEGSPALLRGVYHDQEWVFDVWRDGNRGPGSETRLDEAARPVFVPALDMMGHTRGFLQAANEIKLDFDLTCTDIVSLLGLERRNGNRSPLVLDELNSLLGGKLEYDENSGRFYLITELGRLPMPLVAEGLRKIATLVRLAQNGWLISGTTLFWDEPEVNLNPKLMDEVVRALLAMARQGIQVFIATHSYIILKELDLQSKPTDSVRYFAFKPNLDGTTVAAFDDFALLEPNPILEQYDSLYDRELTRSTGRNRNGEPVR